ncbi:MAG: 50S ribosomal protein L4 [Bacteroidetes bacterium]|jgi:large subunit ribosomal protein L4|nr:50S ribosomal protein L4 [Bacteroidota bacterium]
MELDVLNIEGQPTGRKVQLPGDIFEVEPNDHAIYLDVKRYLAAQRQGTHKSKERNEVSGSTRKLKRQKGTGTARAGSIKSPLFTGGGRIFGPRPRNYDIKVNKKVKALARVSALSYKARENAIYVVEDFSFDAPKTKQYLGFLKNLNIQEVKSLHLRVEESDNVFLASRNLPKAKVILASNINTYDILDNQVLVISEGVMAHFQPTQEN